MKTNERKKIMELESRYDNFEPLLQNLKKSLEEFDKNYESYSQLRDFYSSDEWFTLQEKNHGDLKCGILSQDQLFNFIKEHNDLILKLLELSTKMYKNM